MYRHANHTAGAQGLQLILHFHRFDYCNSLPRLYLIAFADKEPDHFAGHGRFHVLVHVAKQRAGALGGIARIAYLYAERTIAYPGAPLAAAVNDPYLVAAAPVEHRIEPRRNLVHRAVRCRIERHGAAID